MKKLLFWGLILVASMGLTSCDEDEWREQVDVEYVALCSEDLLKFVTPVVTYTDKDIREQEIKMDATTWKQEVDYSIDGTTELPLLEFTAKMHFERKAMPDTIGKDFKFYHDIEAVAATSAVFHEAGTWGGWLGNASETLYTDKVDGNLANVVYTVSGPAIDSFLDYITSKSAYVTIKIGKDGAITKTSNKIEVVTRTE